MNANQLWVIGLGSSGTAAACLGHQKGYAVTGFDDRPRDALDSKHLADLDARGIPIVHELPEGEALRDIMTVVSPGVDLRAERFLAVRRCAKTISEIAFAARWIQNPVIAVTGTNGKSTVCALIEHLIQSAGIGARACGNFGIPLSQVVLEDPSPHTVLVVELSSYQLEWDLPMPVKVAVCLDITENHLNRYGSFEEYEAVKLGLLRHNRTGIPWVVTDSLCRRHADLGSYRSLTRVFPESASGGVHLTIDEQGIDGEPPYRFDWKETPFDRPHLREQLLMALAAVTLLEGDIRVQSGALRTFKTLPYRQEVFAAAAPCMVVNDSKSTSPAAVCMALAAFPRPLVLILGGRHKRTRFHSVRELLKDRPVKVVVYGESRKFLQEALEGAVPVRSEVSLREAVYRAFRWRSGDEAILFSPGCESFDQFRNYLERGKKFNEFVLENTGGAETLPGYPGQPNSGKSRHPV